MLVIAAIITMKNDKNSPNVEMSSLIHSKIFTFFSILGLSRAGKTSINELNMNQVFYLGKEQFFFFLLFCFIIS